MNSNSALLVSAGLLQTSQELSEHIPSLQNGEGKKTLHSQDFFGGDRQWKRIEYQVSILARCPVYARYANDFKMFLSGSILVSLIAG